MTETEKAALPPALCPVEDEPGKPCGRCQGNGEIVADWDRYLSPSPGDTGDEGTAPCPECDGTGLAASPPPPEGEGRPALAAGFAAALNDVAPGLADDLRWIADTVLTIDTQDRDAVAIAERANRLLALIEAAT